MPEITTLVIRESISELKLLMNEQTLARNQQRIQALYLLKSGQCQRASQIAEILGRAKSTVHQWLNLYQKGGLYLLISQRPKIGRKRKIPDSVISKLRTTLQQSHNFNNYQQIQSWLQTEHQISVSYNVVQELVRYHLQIDLKKSRKVF